MPFQNVQNEKNAENHDQSGHYVPQKYHLTQTP
jgi:hypothetical protein